jgi:hypothetical protein
MINNLKLFQDIDNYFSCINKIAVPKWYKEFEKGNITEKEKEILKYQLFL